MPRSVNEAGLALIKQWEGRRLTAYKDTVGVWTIGYGHTDAAGPPAVKRGQKISEAQAETMLRTDLAQYEAAVAAAVTVTLTDNQFAALVSFCFNVGPGNFRGSTLLKKLNAGDHAAVPGELAKWNRAGGKVLPGLANRRAAEAGLWAKGEFVVSNYVEPAARVTATAGPDGKGALAAALGTLGAAAAEAAQQLSPFAEASEVAKHAFIALTVLGVGVALYGVLRRAREEAGLA
ncbi:lysozyme [Ancylobacter sp. Lp-2]|uniref:lysozyme n=1 Tax=Ancylobacter sp. Lp-2 TaxID=2881339 RepID=UPI001E4272AE|nr:lysozyme [Ancylobacter sp. Lp-2]MCB4768907.1 lysozyme [Ancylobacter sp. Lp-2]